ncbi:MAG: MCP four helix bundle domain-containing protein, partial [Syntrophobacteraceae bacterium]
MKMRDLQIATQLRTGLAVLSAFVLVLGALAWFQTESLWEKTATLYEHPLKVRAAVGEIKADFLSIHMEMHDLLLAPDNEEKLSLAQEISVDEGDADRQLQILDAKYLGNRKDVDALRRAILRWQPVRAETLDLIKTGKIAEAARRMGYGGSEERRINDVLELIQHINESAARMAEQLYSSSRADRDAMRRQLAVTLAVILLFSGVISYLLLNGIRRPLHELTSITGKYRSGDFDARSRYVSANELGVLAAAFNDLAQTIQAEFKNRDDAALLASVTANENEVNPFCHELLKALLKQTGAQVGAVYLLDEQRTEFEHLESIGLSPIGRQTFAASTFEGEFGVALATRRPQLVSEIPQDTRFLVRLVTGDFIPREILT